MKEAFRLMRPGAHFVFSVPHPFLLLHEDAKVTSGSRSYFSLRDTMVNFDLGSMILGHGNHGQVSMKFKALEDFILALKEQRFEITEIYEDIEKSKELLNLVIDTPFAMTFKARKPIEMKHSIMAAPKSLDILPEMLIWSGSVRRNFAKSVTVAIPDEVLKELSKTSLKCVSMNICIDDVEFGNHVSELDFQHLRRFGERLRKILLHGTGIVLLHGFDIQRLQSQEITQTTLATAEQMEQCAKLAYYFICRHIGKFV